MNGNKRKNLKVIKDNVYILGLIHKASPWRIPLYFLSIFLSVGTNFLFNVYLLRIVINGMQNNTPFSEILTYILIVGCILIAYYIFSNYYNEVYVPKANKAVYRNIQKMVFDKAAKVDLACYEDPFFYDEYMKAVNETAEISQNVLSSIGNWLQNILTIFSVSLMIFIIDPIFIVFTIIPVVYSLVFGKKLNKLRHERNMEMAELTRRRDYIKRVFYLSDYSKEIRLTEISNVLFGRFFDVIKEIKGVIVSHGGKISVIDYFSIVIQHVFLLIGSIVYSTYRTVVLKNMLFGDCVIIINNIVSTASAINGIVTGYMDLHANSLAIQNIHTFISYEPRITDGTRDVPTSSPTLSFKNINFSYGDTPILKDITFTIKPGEKIALVGHNGAGKSTLVKLLLRFYDPDSGSIELDEKNIKEYKLSDYRNIFSAVFQHFKIFSMSVVENILLKDDITEPEKEAAIDGMKNAGIYDKIMSLPNRENTVLTKEFEPAGAVLSGGEAQKIAIARVFTKDCKVVIMDEPSSALDPIAEYNMYEAMMRACKDKSVIYISHRLSSVVLADRVLLLEHGEITESGTHKELLDLGGKYAEMWNKQSEQYKKGVKANV